MSIANALGLTGALLLVNGFWMWAGAPYARTEKAGRGMIILAGLIAVSGLSFVIAAIWVGASHA